MLVLRSSWALIPFATLVAGCPIDDLVGKGGDAGPSGTDAAPDDGGAAPSKIAFVQNASLHTESAVMLTVPFGSAQGHGNLAVVVVGLNSNTTNIENVTDAHANTYALALGPTRGNGQSQSIYYAKNIVGGQGNQVTVTLSSASFMDVRTLEYQGIDPIRPLDVVAGAVGTSTAPDGASSGVATTTSASALIFGAGTTSGAFSKPGLGFTLREITPCCGNITEDRIVSSGGAYAATGTATKDWAMQMVTFRAAAP
jgi:hypothetical protein